MSTKTAMSTKTTMSTKTQEAPQDRGPLDPRLYQIAVLTSLLAYGSLVLDLEVVPLIAGTLLGSALLTQWIATYLVGLPHFDPKSALISGLSLCLLLRTHHPHIAMLAGILAVGSKFVIRRHGKHVFNPTNFGIVAVLLLHREAWVSPGQWGSAALAAFALACLGMVVTLRAERSDVTWGFLLSYSTLLFTRAAWLGDPWSIPAHQLSTGAFLIFTFFMISDPKTTPDRRAGRLLYAFLVAVVAAWIRFGLYRPNDLLWALAICAPLVPLIDHLLPARRYRWPNRWLNLRAQAKASAAPTHSPTALPRPSTN
jgi:Na+-transporting NADH:ubiquinone oxidoreductase subunit NqrB